MANKLKGAVAVITGASSGIGRATALAFAARGTSVVVAARRESALRTLVAEIERTGGKALAVATDVTDEKAVQRLAQRAGQQFGKIDIWVNNAGVILYGPFTETPLEDYRRVMETNFFGCVNGSRAALTVFQKQGNGTLINLSSMVTRLPQPYASAYVASKHAVHALGKCLRQELLLAKAKDIHVVNVLPAAIDTPLFQHGGNYTGRKPQPPPPVYDVDVVAGAILKAATNPKRDIYAGRAGMLVNLQSKFAPGMVEKSAATLVDKGGFEDTPAEPTSGNLFAPMTTGSGTSGGWKPSGSSPVKRLAKAGAVALPAIALARRFLQRTA